MIRASCTTIHIRINGRGRRYRKKRDRRRGDERVGRTEHGREEECDEEPGGNADGGEAGAAAFADPRGRLDEGRNGRGAHEAAQDAAEAVHAEGKLLPWELLLLVHKACASGVTLKCVRCQLMRQQTLQRPRCGQMGLLPPNTSWQL